MNPVLWVDAPYSIRNEGDKSSSSFTHAEIFTYEVPDLPPYNGVLIRTPEQTNKEFYEKVNQRLFEVANSGRSSYQRKLDGQRNHQLGCVTFYFGNSSLTTGQVAAVNKHTDYSNRRHFLIWIARWSMQKDIRRSAREALLDMLSDPHGGAGRLLGLLDYALVEGLIDQDWHGWFVRKVEDCRVHICPVAWRESVGNTVADALMPEVIGHLEKATCQH